VKRIDGDHAILYHRSRPLDRPVVIRLGKELSPFEVKNNLRTAGISREKYLDLLKKKKRRKKKARPRRGK
jgi:hypothetical protein